MLMSNSMHARAKSNDQPASLTDKCNHMNPFWVVVHDSCPGPTVSTHRVQASKQCANSKQPATSRLQAIKDTGALYLEAPVSGSKAPAEKGQLIFLCGGDKELYDQATPLLKVMGKAQFLLGEV